MSLIFNGTTIEKVIFNGTEIEKLIYNGTTVFESSYVIYDNGTINKAIENGVYNFYEYSGYTNLGGWIFNTNNIERPSITQNGCWSFCTRDPIDFSKYKKLTIATTDGNFSYDISGYNQTGYLTLASVKHDNTTGYITCFLSTQKQYFYSNCFLGWGLTANDNGKKYYITKIWLE